MNGIGSLTIDDYIIGVGSFCSINRRMRASIEAHYKKRKLRGFVFSFAKLNDLEHEKERYNRILTYLSQRKHERFDFLCKITKSEMVLTGRVLYFDCIYSAGRSRACKATKHIQLQLIFAYKKLERVVNGTND